MHRERGFLFTTQTLETMVFMCLWGDADNNGYSALLYDTDDELLHTWVWDYQEIDPDGPLNGADMPLDLNVLQNGSIIVNFDEGDTLSRLDACGNLVWVKKAFITTL